MEKKKKPHQKSQNRNEPILKVKFFYLNIIFILVMLLLSFYGIVSIYRTENYLREIEFLLILIPVGIVVGMIFYHQVLCRLIKGLRTFKDKDINFKMYTVIGFASIACIAGESVNSSWSTVEHCGYYNVRRKSTAAGRSLENYVFVSIDGEEQRLNCSDETWEKFSEGGSFHLCIMNGALGFNYAVFANP